MKKHTTITTGFFGCTLASIGGVRLVSMACGCYWISLELLVALECCIISCVFEARSLAPRCMNMLPDILLSECMHMICQPTCV